MARLWARRRKDLPEPAHRAPAEPAPSESVRLDGDDHAWWAQEEVTQAWRPKVRPAEPEPEADILAEHFGPDWRTSFGFTATQEPTVEPAEPTERDPYEVLGVEPTATWDEIVAAHRRQARINHPDLLFGQSEQEKAEGEERIRVINAAYRELQVRRGV
jgi:DnaJ-domain-containing protein 1